MSEKKTSQNKERNTRRLKMGIKYFNAAFNKQCMYHG